MSAPVEPDADGQGGLVPDRYVPQQKKRPRIETAWMGKCESCETIFTSRHEREDCPQCGGTLDRLSCLYCGHLLPLTNAQVCVTCTIDSQRD